FELRRPIGPTAVGCGEPSHMNWSERLPENLRRVPEHCETTETGCPYRMSGRMSSRTNPSRPHNARTGWQAPDLFDSDLEASDRTQPNRFREDIPQPNYGRPIAGRCNHRLRGCTHPSRNHSPCVWEFPMRAEEGPSRMQNTRNDRISSRKGMCSPVASRVFPS